MEIPGYDGRAVAMMLPVAVTAGRSEVWPLTEAGTTWASILAYI